MSAINVECHEADSTWTCDVTVDDGSDQSHHTVTVPKTDYETLTDGTAGIEELVRESFEYLLEREPKESILDEFDLMTIERYFPDYPDEIKNQLS